MKHLSKFLTISAVALFAAVGCREQFNEDFAEFSPAGDFSIRISTTPLTKTESDIVGNITFAVGDKINLFHAPHSSGRSYSKYENDGCFIVTAVDENGATLTGELSEDLRNDYNYDWFASYPYNSETTSPENTVINFKSSVSCGSEPTSALAGEACPLAGEANSVKGGVTPVLQMRQIASIIAVKVMNTTEDDIVVNSVEVGSFTNSLSGTIAFNTNQFVKFPTDPDELGWIEDEDFGISQWGKVDGSERFESKIIDPGYKVKLNVDGVTLEPYDPVTFYIPVAPTTFMNMGENFSIKVNEIYKPVTMWPHKLFYIPFSSPNDFRYLRHKFNSGKVQQFSFEYSCTDLESTACEWSSSDEVTPDKRFMQPNCFNNSTDIIKFLGCTATVKAQATMANSSAATMWLQSYGTAFFAAYHMNTLYYLMENEGPVFCIPVNHVSGGSKIVLETRMGVDGYDDQLDSDAFKNRNEWSVMGTETDERKAWESARGDTNGKNEADFLCQGGGAYYMIEYSLNQGASWTPANIISEGRYEGPVNANFCFPQGNDSGNSNLYTMTAECPVSSDLSMATFMVRIKCVNSAFNVKDVNEQSMSGSRTKYITDLQNQPGMHGGALYLKPLNTEEKYGVFARISIQ